MAGDWIKMRVGLTNHPKVMRIAECLVDDADFRAWSALDIGVPALTPRSERENMEDRYAALRVTRYVAVAALLRFWGYANEHAKEEKVASLFARDVDEIAGVPGFSAALEATGWAVFDPRGGVMLPNFCRHNIAFQERSSSAERQKRYRERKREALEKEDATRDVTSVTSQVTPREEKRREEKKEKNVPRLRADVERPDGVAEQTWEDFLALRKAKHSPLTATALRRIQEQASKGGKTLEQALATCCERGWQGYQADWDASSQRSGQRQDPFAGVVV